MYDSQEKGQPLNGGTLFLTAACGEESSLTYTLPQSRLTLYCIANGPKEISWHDSLGGFRSFIDFRGAKVGVDADDLDAKTPGPEVTYHLKSIFISNTQGRAIEVGEFTEGQRTTGEGKLEPFFLATIGRVF